MAALLVVIHNAIDPTAHGREAHLPGIVGLQYLRLCFGLCHARIEPKIVAIRTGITGMRLCTEFATKRADG
jgi:hypothetical protein